MKKLVKITGIVMLAIGIGWTFLTVWAERIGPKRSWQLGSHTIKKKALIVYDPAPIYNLDEQLNRAFGQAMADQGMRVTIATVATVPDLVNQPVDLYVFFANTYKWRPDWGVSNFIREKESNVIVTLSMAYSWCVEIAKRHGTNSAVSAQLSPTY